MIQKIIIKETLGCFDNIGIEIDVLKKLLILWTKWKW